MKSHRQAIHDRYQKMLAAPDRDSLLPAADFAQSVRDLSPVQKEVLGDLLREFSEHPAARTRSSILAGLD